jgi:carboxylate-amine ligase
MEELLEMFDEDADALGCKKEVQHVKTVLKRGTSAERQIKCFDAAKAKGMSEEDALKAVVDELLKETLQAT